MVPVAKDISIHVALGVRQCFPAGSPGSAPLDRSQLG
jgi:hypothetical protein